MDNEILEQLYCKYYGAAYAYCVTLCGNPHLAQDIVADAFVKACLSLPNDTPSFRYWLLRVCRNLWIDHCRKLQYVTSEEALYDLSDGHTLENEYLQKEQHQALWKALRTLSPTDRELVVLHYFSELSLQEIAPILNVSYSAARQRLSRLRKKLKQQMEEQGYGKY